MAIAAFALALVLPVAVLAPAAGAVGRSTSFAAARHRKHHAKHHAKHHTKKVRKPTVNAAAAQQRAAAARAAAARKAAKPHPKAHKAKHRRAKPKRRRSALLLAVAAHLRAEHRAKARRLAAKPSSSRKARTERLSAASVTTTPSPLRIAGLALLALLPFALIDAGLIWTDRRRRRVPEDDVPALPETGLFQS